ncbi:polar amino acid transport system permease protein [Polaromonas sp. OV174]|uniref:amino acid ABC transporter permease n=1 Tax=Polaromonas sp. OV174 TaxID=1855300 RepID=UPI0008EC75DF|nr:amino acid ABC transporter permease [Polaromonas sp. OV174]SFC72560.1 polar amino acid transport system permease protein [Polaromonas sp. OV174]
MSMIQGFEWGVVLRDEYREILLKGIATTLELTGGTLLGGMLLGAVLSFARLSPSSWLRRPATLFVEITCAVPLLVHLLFWYFGAPELLPDALKAWLYRQDVGFYASLVALILYSSAFISEDLRSGIRSIPHGQLEAAQSLGFGFVRSFRLVILPQALKAVIPPLLGQAMTITKNTSVALMVGVGELVYVTRAVQNSSFRTVETYAFTSVFFLLVAVVLTLLSRVYERRNSLQA